METITTVAYGEYYPITPLGRLISSVLMFAAIGILWCRCNDDIQISRTQSK
jgi:hypothetical protein